jgi:hypothetical protein
MASSLKEQVLISYCISISAKFHGFVVYGTPQTVDYSIIYKERDEYFSECEYIPQSASTNVNLPINGRFETGRVFESRELK